MNPLKYLQDRDHGLKTKIKQLREDRKLTQDQVAKAVGCSRTKVTNVENPSNPAMFTISEMEIFCNLVGIHPMQFMQLTDADTLSLSMLNPTLQQQIFTKAVKCELPKDVYEFMDGSANFAPSLLCSPSGKLLTCWIDEHVIIEEEIYDYDETLDYPFNILVWNTENGQLLKRLSLPSLESYSILSDHQLLTHQIIKGKSVFSLHEIHNKQISKLFRAPAAEDYAFNQDLTEVSLYYPELGQIHTHTIHTKQNAHTPPIRYKIGFTTDGIIELVPEDRSHLLKNLSTRDRWGHTQELHIFHYDQNGDLVVGGSQGEPQVFSNAYQLRATDPDERYDQGYFPYSPDAKKHLDSYRIAYEEYDDLLPWRSKSRNHANLSILALHYTLPGRYEPYQTNHVEGLRFVSGHIADVSLIDKHCILGLVVNNLSQQHGISFLNRYRLINFVNQISVLIPTDRDNHQEFNSIHQAGATFSPNNDYIAYWLTTMSSNPELVIQSFNLERLKSEQSLETDLLEHSLQSQQYEEGYMNSDFDNEKPNYIEWR